jgi:hypothetical protein
MSFEKHIKHWKALDISTCMKNNFTFQSPKWNIRRKHFSCHFWSGETYNLSTVWPAGINTEQKWPVYTRENTCGSNRRIVTLYVSIVVVRRPFYDDYDFRGNLFDVAKSCLFFILKMIENIIRICAFM